MTHQYTLLLGATILPGLDARPASAIAWAEGTVLAIGSDDEVLSISRGDSTIVRTRRAWIVPLGAEPEPTWPPDATLDVGGSADLAVLDGDPRRPGEAAPASGTRPGVIALVRNGRIVAGALPR